MDYVDYLTQAFEQFNRAHEQWKLTYRIDEWEAWHYDELAGILTFSTGDEKIYFRYVPVGSFSTKTDTWLWSWHNQHTSHPQKKLTGILRVFGEENEFEALTTGHQSDEGDAGWEFTAIAYDRLGGLGGYRVKSDHLFIYMLITDKVENEEAEHLIATTKGRE